MGTARLDRVTSLLAPVRWAGWLQSMFCCCLQGGFLTSLIHLAAVCRPLCLPLRYRIGPSAPAVLWGVSHQVPLESVSYFGIFSLRTPQVNSAV